MFPYAQWSLDYRLRYSTFLTGLRGKYSALQACYVNYGITHRNLDVLGTRTLTYPNDNLNYKNTYFRRCSGSFKNKEECIKFYWSVEDEDAKKPVIGQLCDLRLRILARTPNNWEVIDGFDEAEEQLHPTKAHNL